MRRWQPFSCCTAADTSVTLGVMRAVGFAIATAVLGCGGSPSPDTPADAAGDTTPDAELDADAAAPTGSAQLVAIWPSVARTGQTVVLEGDFSGQPTIVFPGGATAYADVLGEHRATAVVPANATVGNATGTGGATGGRVLFHAVTYQPGLRPFARYDQADAAHTEPMPVEALTDPGAIALEQAIYVIGGLTTSAATDHVEAAAILADGTLGRLEILPDVSLVSARSGFAIVKIDAHVYVIGGAGGAGAYTTIERASAVDGRLSTFEVASSQLNLARVDPTATVVGDYLYVMGGTGYVDTDTLETIERASIAPDGTLGPFELLEQRLAEGRADANSIVSGNQLYVYGGSPVQSTSTNVQAAPIQPDGTLGPFAIVPDVSLRYPRTGFASAVIGDGLYLFGGNEGGTYTVDRAPILADGTLGTFEGTGVGLLRSQVAVAIAGNSAYVIGGVGLDPVLHASINLSAAIGSSVETTSELDTAVSSSGLVTSATAVYLLGGVTASGGFSDGVQAGAITDGIVGDFAPVAGSQLVTARAELGTLVVGNLVYVIGGDTAAGQVGSIEVATIGDDGSLGPFTTVGSALVTPRSQFATAVIDRNAGSFLLVLGGVAANGTTLDTIEQAQILPDGTLGTFSVVGQMTTPRRGHSAMVTMMGTNEMVFLIGGTNATGALDDIERGTVDRTTQSFFGTFTVPNTGLTVARAGQSIAVFGDHVYVLGGDGGAGPLDSVELATFTDDTANPLTEFAPVAGVTLAEPRGYARCATIANQVYCFGGTGTGGALSTVEAAPLQ